MYKYTRELFLNPLWINKNIQSKNYGKKRRCSWKSKNIDAENNNERSEDKVEETFYKAKQKYREMKNRN